MRGRRDWYATTTPEIKYSTVQNCTPRFEGKGGIYNFRHQARRLPRARGPKNLVDPGETDRRSNLEISELHPERRVRPRGEFYSIAISNAASRSTAAPR